MEAYFHFSKAAVWPKNNNDLWDMEINNVGLCEFAFSLVSHNNVDLMMVILDMMLKGTCESAGWIRVLYFNRSFSQIFKFRKKNWDVWLNA